MGKASVLVSGVFILLVLAVVCLMLAPGDFAEAVSDVRTGILMPPSEGDLLAEDIRYLSVVHAVERHGDISITIKEFCEMDPKLVAVREIDGRQAVGCEYQPGKFGVSIYEEDGDFVTAFPNKAKTLQELARYFKNRGYFQ